jgi:hypothetical protein
MGLRPWGECASVPAEAFVFFTIFYAGANKFVRKKMLTQPVKGFYAPR